MKTINREEEIKEYNNWHDSLDQETKDSIWDSYVRIGYHVTSPNWEVKKKFLDHFRYEKSLNRLPYESECTCDCHKVEGMVHMQPCCQPDPIKENTDGN